VAAVPKKVFGGSAKKVFGGSAKETQRDWHEMDVQVAILAVMHAHTAIRTLEDEFRFSHGSAFTPNRMILSTKSHACTLRQHMCLYRHTTAQAHTA
jgi:hypothetical protein